MDNTEVVPSLPWQAGAVINIARLVYKNKDLDEVLSYFREYLILYVTKKFKERSLFYDEGNRAYSSTLLGKYLKTYAHLSFEDFLIDHFSTTDRYVDDFLVGVNWLHCREETTNVALTFKFKIQEDLYNVNFNKKFPHFYINLFKDTFNKPVFLFDKSVYLLGNYKFGTKFQTVKYQTEFTKKEIFTVFPALKKHTAAFLEPIEIPKYAYDSLSEKRK